MHEREQPVVEAIRQRLIKKLRANHASSVTGCGERDAWRQTAAKRAAAPSSRLPPGRPQLLRHLDECNPCEDANALTGFFARFDPPADAEDVIVYRGDMGTLVTALRNPVGAGESLTETATGTSDLRLQLDITTAMFPAREHQLIDPKRFGFWVVGWV